MAPKGTQNKEQRRAQERHIRAKIECDKAAYQVQWRLLDGTVNERCLIAAAELLQPNHYQDITTERALDSRCGYPCCGESLRKGVTGSRIHISVSQRKVRAAPCPPPAATWTLTLGLHPLQRCTT